MSVFAVRDTDDAIENIRDSFVDYVSSIFRSSRPEVFCEKGVLKNFTKFTEKHLCQSLFFNRDADLRPATLLKKRLWHRCFHPNFKKFLRTPFLIEHLCWLLLHIQHSGDNYGISCSFFLKI